MFGWIQHNRCLLSQILFTYQLKFGWVGWPFGAECKWRRVWKQWEKPAQLSMYRQLHRPLSFRCEIQFRERAYAVNIRLHCKWRLVLISAFHWNVDLQLLQPWCKEWRENVGERKIKVKGKKRGKKKLIRESRCRERRKKQDSNNTGKQGGLGGHAVRTTKQNCEPMTITKQ